MTWIVKKNKFFCVFLISWQRCWDHSKPFGMSYFNYILWVFQTFFLHILHRKPSSIWSYQHFLHLTISDILNILQHQRGEVIDHFALCPKWLSIRAPFIYMPKSRFCKPCIKPEIPTSFSSITVYKTQKTKQICLGMYRDDAMPQCKAKIACGQLQNIHMIEIHLGLYMLYSVFSLAKATTSKSPEN